MPSGAGRGGILGLGRAEEHLDLRMEVDLLGKRKYLCLESSSLWRVGHQVQGSVLAMGAWASHWAVCAWSPNLQAQCQSGAALGNASICALSNGGACTVAALKATRTGLPSFVAL